MEYHCLNVLIIKGSQEDIQQLAGKLLKPIVRCMQKPGTQPAFLLSFDGILPTPEGFEASLGPYKPGPEPLTPIDRWRIRHWGTRGRPKTRCVRLKSNTIEVYFETVWSPPEGVYLAIKDQFPNVRIKTCCSHP